MGLERRNPSDPAAHWMRGVEMHRRKPKTATSTDWQNVSSIDRKRDFGARHAGLGYA